MKSKIKILVIGLIMVLSLGLIFYQGAAVSLKFCMLKENKDKAMIEYIDSMSEWRNQQDIMFNSMVKHCSCTNMSKLDE